MDKRKAYELFKFVLDELKESDTIHIEEISNHPEEDIERLNSRHEEYDDKMKRYLDIK